MAKTRNLKNATNTSGCLTVFCLAMCKLKLNLSQISMSHDSP